MARDAVAVAPDHYSVVEDNDRVRILEFRGGPGTVTEMHSHPTMVVVALTNAKVRSTLPDGQSREMELNSGTVMYQDAKDHATEVLGSSETRVILIELK